MNANIRRFQKPTAVPLTAVFLFITLSRPFAEARLYAAPAEPARRQESRSAHAWFGPQQLPKDLGTVSETFFSRHHNADKNKPALTLYHIQDAHGVYGAQINTARILKKMTRFFQDAPLTVCQEGGTGPAPLKALHSFPFPEVLEKVAFSYLKQGRFTGEEYAALTHQPVAIHLAGVENEDLYQKNLQARHRTKQDRERVIHYLKNWKRRMQGLKTRIYPRDLILLDKKINSYMGSHGSADIKIKELVDLSPANLRQKQFPHLYASVKARDLSESMDAARLERERTALFKAVEEHLGMEDLQELAAAAAETRLGQQTRLMFYQRLLEAGQALGKKKIYMSLNAVRQYTESLRLMDSVEAHALIAECRQWKRTLYGKYMHQPDIKTIIDWNDSLEAEICFWRQSLSPAQYESYQNTAPADWALEEKKLFVMERQNNIRRAPLSLTNFNWTQKRRQAEEFYRCALQRDRALAQNAVKAIQAQGKNKGILIAGGFHTPGIVRWLKQNNVHYVVIRPRLEPAPQKDFFAEEPDLIQITCRGIREMIKHSLRESLQLLNPGFSAELLNAVVACAVIDRVLSQGKNTQALNSRILAQWMQDHHPGFQIHAAKEIINAEGKRQVLLMGKNNESPVVLVYEFADGQTGSDHIQILAGPKADAPDGMQKRDVSHRLGELKTRPLSNAFAAWQGLFENKKQGASWQEHLSSQKDVAVVNQEGDEDLFASMAQQAAGMTERLQKLITPQAQAVQEQVNAFSQTVQKSSDSVRSLILWALKNHLKEKYRDFMCRWNNGGALRDFMLLPKKAICVFLLAGFMGVIASGNGLFEKSFQSPALMNKHESIETVSDLSLALADPPNIAEMLKTGSILQPVKQTKNSSLPDLISQSSVSDSVEMADSSQTAASGNHVARKLNRHGVEIVPLDPNPYPVDDQHSDGVSESIIEKAVQWSAYFGEASVRAPALIPAQPVFALKQAQSMAFSGRPSRTAKRPLPLRQRLQPALDFIGLSKGLINLPGRVTQGHALFLDARQGRFDEQGHFSLSAPVALSLFHQLNLLSRQGLSEGKKVSIDVLLNDSRMADDQPIASEKVFSAVMAQAEKFYPDMNRALPDKINFQTFNLHGKDESAFIKNLADFRSTEGLNVQVLTEASEASLKFWKGLDIPGLSILAAGLAEKLSRLDVDVILTGEFAALLAAHMEKKGQGHLLDDMRDEQGRFTLPAVKEPAPQQLLQDKEEIRLFQINA